MRLAPARPPAAVAVSLAREALQRGRPFRDRTQGGSMRPLLPAGSEIEVAPCDPARLGPGDVVLVALPGRGLVAHRLLLPPRPGRRAVTKGDRAPAADPPLAPAAVLGRVVGATLPGGRRRDLRAPAWRAVGWLMALASPWVGLLETIGRSVRR